MSWQRSVLNKFSLYAVTDLKGHDPAFFSRAEAALKGGVDVLQLRSKNLSDLELVRIGEKLRKLTAKLRKLFIINDRADLAALLGADGVHLGQDDLPVEWARRFLKDRNKIIGKSTHSLSQALAAQKEKADYIGVGPVYSTPTKPDYSPVGLVLVGQAARKIKIPFVAIGGIDASNISDVVAAGARRVAVVRALWAHENTFKAAQYLKEQLRQHEMPLLQV